MLDIDNIVYHLRKKIDENNILLNEPMSKHTTFKIGGNADVFVKAKSTEQIQYILEISKENNIPIYIIGNGSNILVRDKGIRGIVLKIELEDINIIENNENINVTVGAGVKLALLAQELKKKSITGLEFASGIPGTIGGAVRMNAGAYGFEMKDIVLETKYIDLDGNICILRGNQHEFEYRKSFFSKNKYVIIETTLNLKKGNIEEIQSKMNEYLIKRKEKQPIGVPNAGSTFKRGNDFITAKLIDECGLKGYKLGDAEVSSKHAGFIVNTKNATAKDVRELINYVKQEVYKKFNKKIELEIEIIGEE